RRHEDRDERDDRHEARDDQRHVLEGRADRAEDRARPARPAGPAGSDAVGGRRRGERRGGCVARTGGRPGCRGVLRPGDAVLRGGRAQRCGAHTRSPLSSGTTRRCTHEMSRTMISRTTAIAEARPTFENVKAVLTVWMTNVSDPFAPPVMMNGISNTDSAPDTARITDSPMICRIPGAMMKRNFCHAFAPSRSAASYSSFGIDWIAPRKSTKFRPM